jgi:hypothetical protein
MTASAELLNQVLSLPSDERAEFAHQILLSLEPADYDADWREAWRHELAARHARIESGNAMGRDWRDVIADARNSLNA